jgi:hypothetical protein
MRGHPLHVTSDVSPERRQDGIDNGVELATNLVVWKPQCPVTQLRKSCITRHISRTPGMLVTVHLNDQQSFPAAEVCVVPANRLLPHKLVATAASVLQAEPEKFFFESGLPTQGAGAGRGGLRRCSHTWSLRRDTGRFNPRDFG